MRCGVRLCDAVHRFLLQWPIVVIDSANISRLFLVVSCVLQEEGYFIGRAMYFCIYTLGPWHLISGRSASIFVAGFQLVCCLRSVLVFQFYGGERVASDNGEKRLQFLIITSTGLYPVLCFYSSYL